jgi:hypothetical protein
MSILIGADEARRALPAAELSDAHCPRDQEVSRPRLRCHCAPGRPLYDAVRELLRDRARLETAGSSLVNEETLVPILLPFAPAASLLDRFGPGLEEVLRAHGGSSSFVGAEMAEARECRLAKTNNRSFLGSMNEFASLADVFRETAEVVDLQALSLWLAGDSLRSALLTARHAG